jgi:hypothetical protein
MPNTRTSDHVFILKAAIDKYISKKKKLYACFVDFRKAFDSVWHGALFLKLQRLGIGGLFYNLIKKMYSCNQLCVRTPEGLTPFFPSKVGVRQGCALSPLLFNIFIGDLPAILKNNYPVTLFSKEIIYLLYADDLVILSECPDDLQRNLNALHDYCDKWSLAINPSKTKVIVFSKPVRTIKTEQVDNHFTPSVGNTNLEVVDEYKYLGIVFTSNGSFNSAKVHLEKRANKALFGMHSYLRNSNLPLNCCVDLFEKLIQPIACFGSEIWAPYNFSMAKVLKGKCSIFSKYNEFPGAKIILKFCKRILKVNEKSVNLAVLGELGKVPSIIPVISSIVNFWIHVIQSPEDGLLFDAYLSSYDRFYKGSGNKWFQIIKFLSQTYPSLSSFWQNHRADFFNKNSIQNVLRRLHTSLNLDFKRFWSSEITKCVQNNSSGGRLKLFSNVKVVFGLEQYLLKIKNLKHRQLFTQMRISAHSLQVEKGRHNNTLREHRICRFCNNGSIEDEMHFVLDCPKYAIKRTKFLSRISLLYPNFPLLSKEDRLIFLLTNLDSAPLTASYLFEINSKRLSDN